MKYVEEFVKRIVEPIIQGRMTCREVALKFRISRNTVTRWVKRRLDSLPTWFARTANNVANAIKQPLLAEIKQSLANTRSAVITWLKVGKQVCLRTVYRWKAKWFPKPTKEKVKCKRYQRSKPFSLLHADWATKRIINGMKIAFSFCVDDCTRTLYALHAYRDAGFVNTVDNFSQALKETKHEIKAILTDCGRVYHQKCFGVVTGSFGIKLIHTRPYHPQCNGKAEAIVKKVKNYLNQFIVRDLEHANELLVQYQKQYNNTPHSSLNYQTPLEVLRQKTGAICAVS